MARVSRNSFAELTKRRREFRASADLLQPDTLALPPFAPFVCLLYDFVLLRATCTRLTGEIRVHDVDSGIRETAS